MKAIGLRRVSGDGPHRQVVGRQQSFRGLQRKADIFAEGLQMNLWFRVHAPLVHRMQHRHDFVRRHYDFRNICKTCIYIFTRLSQRKKIFKKSPQFKYLDISFKQFISHHISIILSYY